MPRHSVTEMIRAGLLRPDPVSGGYVDFISMSEADIQNMFETVPPPGEIPLELRDDEPFRPNLAIITEGFGVKARRFEEGFKVEIVDVHDDPTKADRRSIVIRVIDDKAPPQVKGAIACVSSHRLKLVV